ncbi:MAG TPA: hypothetical protein VMF50_15625 [Candidatus Binataceae bacterium]|nr:hypothetical protein [Candidatus Binataceae bacterium]
MKLLTAAFALTALFMLAPRMSYADSDQNCYNHPSDHSDFCYCYRHPKKCNAHWRRNHPDWNRRPSWYHEANNSHEYNHNHPDSYNGGGHYHNHPDYNGQHHQGPPSNTYQQQYH